VIVQSELSVLVVTNQRLVVSAGGTKLNRPIKREQKGQGYQNKRAGWKPALCVQFRFNYK